MASGAQSEDDLLALDDAEVVETKECTNNELDSKEEDKLLSKDDSDIESLPEVEDDSVKTATLSETKENSSEVVASFETSVSESQNSTPLTTTASSTSATVSPVNMENNESQNQARHSDNSDEDIVEIAVVKNNANPAIQNSTLSSSLQAERIRRAREEERKRLLQRDKVSEFNFRSNRLQQQRKRVRYNTDGMPVIFADDYDFCDCLMPDCPGCHYPCKMCGDCRCGHECRVNRRYVYESIELEGRSIVLKTPKNISKSSI